MKLTSLARNNFAISFVCFLFFFFVNEPIKRGTLSNLVPSHFQWMLLNWCCDLYFMTYHQHIPVKTWNPHRLKRTTYHILTKTKTKTCAFHTLIRSNQLLKLNCKVMRKACGVEIQKHKPKPKKRRVYYQTRLRIQHLKNISHQHELLTPNVNSEVTRNNSILKQ